MIVLMATQNSTNSYVMVIETATTIVLHTSTNSVAFLWMQAWDEGALAANEHPTNACSTPDLAVFSWKVLSVIAQQILCIQNAIRELCRNF